MKLTIDLNEEKILKKVTNERFGKFVSNSWKILINPYTPHDTGVLEDTVEISPFELHYKSPYSSAVYDNNRNVTFHQTYNPFATDHWDEKAAEAGQLNKLYRTLNSYLNTGR